MVDQISKPNSFRQAPLPNNRGLAERGTLEAAISSATRRERYLIYIVARPVAQGPFVPRLSDLLQGSSIPGRKIRPDSAPSAPDPLIEQKTKLSSGRLISYRMLEYAQEAHFRSDYGPTHRVLLGSASTHRFTAKYRSLPPGLSRMTVEVPGSVTPWLSPLQAGDPAATEYLWSRYFELAVQLARTQLLGVEDRGRDEEDVALSALHDFFRAAGRRDLDRLRNRQDLWRLLATCTLNRARKLRRDSQRLKRGGAVPRIEPLSRKPPQRVPLSRELTPDESCQIADQIHYLLELLDLEDPTRRLRQIAVWKLEGFTDQEIAQCQKCTRKTIAAKLTLIRALWREASQS